MASFLTNKCQYSNCGRAFLKLNDLIIHIEDTHIDFDPKTLEESERSKPLCVPMSYVLRYKRTEKKPEPEGAVGRNGESPESGKFEHTEIIKDIKIEEDESPSSSSPVVPDEQFNSPWCADSGRDPCELKCKSKKFCCPITGCSKRYKNQNGMKYHIVNYHDITGKGVKPKKEFKCQCGREYKTLRGLQSHTTSHKDSQHGRVSVNSDSYQAASNALRRTPDKAVPKISEVARNPGFISYSTIYPDFRFNEFAG